MYAKVLLTTHCAHPSLIGPLELANMMTHISQSVSVLNITPYGNIYEYFLSTFMIIFLLTSIKG